MKLPLWAVTLLLIYFGCHLMITLCLFSLLKSFLSLCCFSAAQAPNGLRSIKLTAFSKAVKTSIINIKNIAASAVAAMSLHHSSFLTTDCGEDHQATFLEKGTYSLALFTNLKQKLQFCKHFVNAVRKNSGNIVLFAH